MSEWEEIFGAGVSAESVINWIDRQNREERRAEREDQEEGSPVAGHGDHTFSSFREALDWAKANPGRAITRIPGGKGFMVKPSRGSSSAQPPTRPEGVPPATRPGGSSTKEQPCAPASLRAVNSPSAPPSPRDPVTQTPPPVSVKRGDWITVGGYRLRVGQVRETGEAYLELLDDDGSVVAACPTDGRRLVADPPDAAPPAPKTIPQSARGRRYLVEDLVAELEGSSG